MGYYETPLRKEIMRSKIKKIAVPVLYVAAAYMVGATIEYGAKALLSR